MKDIDKDTVDFMPNYDNRLPEPTVLPSRFPNLLVNGSMGIAVGMATNIPPHNLREVCDAVLYLLDNDNATVADLMEYIKAPDFPTGGTILGLAGVRAAYATGRGRVKVRAKAEVEEHKGRTRIVVTEMPYQVVKSNVVKRIAELANEKESEGISAVRDESDHRGMKMVVDLKRDANPQVVLNQLYSLTDMQTTFAINMLALVNNQPKTMSLREILDHYIAHQKEVITRRVKYDLRKARERMHLLEGLKIAVDNIDEVIRIIRAAYNDAKAQLMERFGLSDIQGQAIVDMRLGRLQGLEIEKLQAEIDELMVKIRDYEDILANDSRVRDIIRGELEIVRDKFSDERRTEIEPVDDEIDIEDLIEVEDCVFSATHFGYIKRQPTNVYSVQRRGGRGVKGQSIREEDFVEDVFVASTHDTLLFFTNFGRLYRKRGFNIPESGRTSKGLNMRNLLPLEENERVSAIIPVKIDDPAEYLVMVTKNGTVKRILRDTLETTRKNLGIRALTLDEGDELIAVRKTDGEQNIIVTTRNAYSICFSETDVRSTGRTSVGVRGIKLQGDDYVIGAARTKADACLMIITEFGYGKRVKLEDMMRGSEGNKQAQNRGGFGLRSYNLTEKTGKVAAVRIVREDDDAIIMSDDGTIIRVPVDTISVYSRAAMGVRVMRLAEGAKVVGFARTAKEAEEVEVAEEDIVSRETI
ncbi:DNA gyrase subunit A [Clostridia bacterium]|nr:DNA gyrase subunit A [Clostridia bacterium]